MPPVSRYRGSIAGRKPTDAVKGCSIRGGDTAFERPTCWSYSWLTDNKAKAPAAALRREQEGGIA
jgi:hypothetical protein